MNERRTFLEVLSIFWDNRGMQSFITLPDIESAINFWRQRSPSVGEELRLCQEASSLATPYALMIMERRAQLDISQLSETAQLALRVWLENSPEHRANSSEQKKA
jgi:hypothetical protein